MADDTVYDHGNPDMFPPVRVRARTDDDEKPSKSFAQEAG